MFGLLMIYLLSLIIKIAYPSRILNGQMIYTYVMYSCLVVELEKAMLVGFLASRDYSEPPFWPLPCPGR